MKILTNNGWEQREWSQDEPFPDEEDGVVCVLFAEDCIPNIDESKTIAESIEKQVNRSTRENEDHNPADNWRMCGVMLRKTHLVDEDPENTSLAGNSYEVDVLNQYSSEDEREEYPHLFRGFIPLSDAMELMDSVGVTGSPELPKEVLEFGDAFGIGLAYEGLVTNEQFEFTLDNLVDEIDESKS